ncbi:MAG: DNA topoisomerase I, DNA topoisomerase I [Microgenomates group bacterium GW2011_GWC1_39_12]|nr:MAG: DNA topoisomerase I, DNA topoisomerase I [Microgenomates group bacterium GW2011_GWC1_39_12]
MTLIIVESPTKAKTLSKFLGKDYQIEATMGHIRDLPKAALGVDVEHGFTPSYLIPKDKKKHVGELLAIARKADTVILATDPDREGEAIAWHMATILTDGIEKKKLTKKTEKKIETFKRITFHEITKSAIDDALAHPGVIDTKLVSAQQARRILDRLVGYKLSPILWQKLSKRWLSAGRVQSVAVRLLVEREREIEKFTKEPYWTIEGDFSGPITAQLISHNEEIYEKQIILQLFDGKYTTTSSTIISEDQANAIIEDLKKPYTVSAVEKKEISRNPSPAYTTSTLQQDAGRRLYFSSKKTMQLAQKLYEEGIITYHRTDSLNLSTKFISEAREYIANTFGKKYIPASARVYHTKSKVAQEAHEAIRPTDVTFLEETLKNNPEFNHDHVRLYEIIWKRAIASQMEKALFDSTAIAITSSNAYVFQVQGSVIMFDGFLKVMGYENGEVVLPTVAVGDTVTLSKANSIFHETQAPPRYTEASLVKALEEKDIGRPSTYAPIISTIIDRQYVAKIEKKLVPTELGMQVTDFLVLYFPRVMDLPFTAKLEADLDAIATGEKEWVLVLKAFYDPFIEAVDTTMKTAEKIKSPVEETDEKCPLCQSPVVIRTGRYGKFYACSTFPACTYTKQKPETIDMKCPKCGSDIVIKKTRHGKTFFGCSTYPTCTFAAWKKEDIK